MKPPSRFWLIWITVWAEVVIAVSALTIVWERVSGDLFNLVIFGEADTPPGFSGDAVDYQKLLFCILSALTIGWMVLLLYVVRNPFARGERWAWTSLAVSSATWFLIDSGASIATGFWRNAVFNVVFFLPLVPALIATLPRRVQVTGE